MDYIPKMDSPKSFRELEQVHSRIHSKTAYYSHHIKEALLRPVTWTAHFLKKYWTSIIAAWALLYMFSPEIWYFKNKWWRVPVDEKTKKEFWIDSIYQTNDWETNTIVRLVTGLADKNDIDSLVKLYWHQQAFDTLFASAVKDTLLYKCYGDLLISIHNPHATFWWDYKRDFLWDALWYDRSHVNAKVEELQSKKQISNIKDKWVFSDTSNIKARLDSSLRKKNILLTEAALLDVLHRLNAGKTITVDSISYSWWIPKIFNSLLAEDGHISLLHKEWLIRNYLNYAGNYIKNWFKQDHLYWEANTVENQTHEEDRWWARGEEWILIAKLLKMYEERMPKNSVWHIERIALFYNWYFEHYKDPVKSQFYQDRLKTLKQQQNAYYAAKKAVFSYNTGKK